MNPSMVAGLPEALGDVLDACAPAAEPESILDLVRRDVALIEDELSAIALAGPGTCAGAAVHLTRAGGKRVRPVAALLAAHAAATTNFDRGRARGVALAAELVHSATLLHDDVMDEGDLRRGQPAARVLYGNLVSVLAGDYLLAAALRSVVCLNDQAIVADLAETLERLVEGEVLQLHARHELCVDRAHYLRVVHGKTASLFGWTTRSGARVGGDSEPVARALGEFGEHLGVAFQLLDDVLDISGNSSSTGKPQWADLREGKVTWPVILAVESGSASIALVRAAREGEASAAAQLFAAITASGAVERTRARAAKETSAALRALEKVPANPGRDALAAVARSLVGRQA